MLLESEDVDVFSASAKNSARDVREMCEREGTGTKRQEYSYLDSGVTFIPL